MVKMIREFADYIIMGATAACCMVLVVCTIDFLYQRIPDMGLLVITVILLSVMGFVLNMVSDWWLNR